QIHTLACIVPTTLVTTFIKPSTSSHAAASHVWHKKGNICFSDLCHHLQADFTKKFTPCLYELFGTLSVWEQPTNNDILRLWKNVFPYEQSLNFGMRKGTIVLKLINDQLLQWRKKFGKHSLEALEEVTFNDISTNNTKHSAWWCTWALSGDDDRCKPFYYLNYTEPNSEDKGSWLKAKVCLLTLTFMFHHTTSSH
ncbi:hypothetical protein EI94DRAFT_1577446, partial [Lactarius quietus]